jgi:hypothetical protein
MGESMSLLFTFVYAYILNELSQRYSPQNNALKESPLALSPKQRIEAASANQEVVDQLYNDASSTGTLPKDSLHQLARAKTYLLSGTDRQALEDVLQVESSLVQVKELNASVPTHIPPENDFSELRYFSPAGLVYVLKNWRMSQFLKIFRLDRVRHPPQERRPKESRQRLPGLLALSRILVFRQKWLSRSLST